jgi:hypothetical protein
VSKMNSYMSQVVRSNLIAWIAFVFALTALSCNPKSSLEDALNQPVCSDFCDVIQNAPKYAGKVINIQAYVTGYHQLVLVSSDCKDRESFILLDLSEQIYDSLREQSQGVRSISGRNNNTIEGKIYLKGTLKIGKGKVVNYGEFVQDIKTGAILQKPKDFEATEIEVSEIISFVPK